jgi:GNAT superfamily N-acetyltransferase
MKKYQAAIQKWTSQYENMGFPYWVFIHDAQPISLIAIGPEPVMLLAPVGAIMASIHLVTLDVGEGVAQELAARSRKLAQENGAAYAFLQIPSERRELIDVFTQQGFETVARSVIMMRPLEHIPDTGDELEYERVGRQDTPDFLRLVRVHMSGSPDIILEKMLKNLSEIPSHILDMWYQGELLYAARKRGNTVGVLDLSPQSETSISNIGVSLEHRRKGFGRQMLIFALGVLKDQGLDTAGLRVHADNEGARALYDSLGFKEQKRLHAMMWFNE